MPSKTPTAPQVGRECASMMTSMGSAPHRSDFSHSLTPCSAAAGTYERSVTQGVLRIVLFRRLLSVAAPPWLRSLLHRRDIVTPWVAEHIYAK